MQSTQKCSHVKIILLFHLSRLKWYFEMASEINLDTIDLIFGVETTMGVIGWQCKIPRVIFWVS